MNVDVLFSPCDETRIAAYLSNDLPSDQMKLVEAHLETCNQCVASLERLATENIAWDDAKQFLSSDEHDGKASLSSESNVTEIEIKAIEDPSQTHPVSGQSASERSAPDPSFDAAMLSREIQGWLDPTDDPNMMGRFAGYEIVGVIGHGGMGIVLKGFEPSLNRFVAIKAMAPRLASSEAARKRFSREAQAAAAVLHENVIAIHRVDQTHGLPYLVMPYWGGESLQKRLDHCGPLGVEASLQIASQIAAGLSAAHARGLIHRDIKPANILLERGLQRVTITDFGLARAADDASLTRTGVVAGTPQYMSPEQARAKPLDVRSDLFSLGSVLYAMLVGSPPFRGNTNYEILESVTNDSPRPPSEIDDAIPAWTNRLVQWLHQKEPKKRPEQASQVQEVIDGCLRHLQNSSEPLPNVVNLSRMPKEREFRARRWSIALAGSTALLFLLFFWNPTNLKQPPVKSLLPTTTKPAATDSATKDSATKNADTKNADTKNVATNDDTPQKAATNNTSAQDIPANEPRPQLGSQSIDGIPPSEFDSFEKEMSAIESEILSLER